MLISDRLGLFQGLLPGRTASCELVIDLFFEKQHVLTGQLTQQPKQLGSSKEATEASMRVDIVLCAAENSLTLSIDLLTHVQYQSAWRCLLTDTSYGIHGLVTSVGQS